MNWPTLISQLGITAIAMSAIAWLVKKLLTQQMLRDLEVFKARLTAETQREHIRFSKLHERRADIIEEAYKRLIHIKALLSLQNSSSSNCSETAEHITKEILDVSYYFGQHGLYFSDELKGKFNRVLVDGASTPLTMIYGMGELEKLESLIKNKFGDDHGVNFKEPFAKHLKKRLPELEELIRDLEHEFQSILGVTR